MSPNYTRAKQGYKFILTSVGAEIGRIRAKFDESSIYKSRYVYCVPKSWISKGYVKEVKEDEVK